MQQTGMIIIFNENCVEVNKSGKPIIKGKPLINLIAIDFVVNTLMVSFIAQIHSTLNSNYILWYQHHLGHIGKSKFVGLKDKQMVDDVDQID